MSIRIGSGFDIHAFGPGDAIMLGGIRVPHTHGVVAHSDGDVLLHALVDAMLGAAALGDIGMHFPDSDPQWRGADSGRFVAHARHLVAQLRYDIVNADLTLLAQAPKIAPWREQMRARVAALLQVEHGCVNIKATTPEHLGFLGRSEGLAAMASVSLALRD
ncbi:MAG TPA: 2-C-methyl-D-erythritol 2,4-cyclodiphosphate synthase [Steroidobacteraceae bacterium]